MAEMPGDARKPGRSLAALAGDCTAEAVETLAAICRDEALSPTARIAAAQALLDRGHGKAVAGMPAGAQSATVTILMQVLEAMPDDERAGLEAALRDGAAEPGAGDGAAGGDRAAAGG